MKVHTLTWEYIHEILITYMGERICSTWASEYIHRQANKYIGGRINTWIREYIHG